MLLLVALRILAQVTTTALPVKAPLIPPLPTLAMLSNSPELVDWAYLVTDRMRNVSLALTIIMFLMYDRYHQATVKYRWTIPGGRLGVQSADRSLRPFPVCMVE
jgi:hypothetical protein